MSPYRVSVKVGLTIYHWHAHDGDLALKGLEGLALGSFLRGGAGAQWRFFGIIFLLKGF